MCSIAEEDFGDEGGEHAMVAAKSPGPAEQCRKCQSTDVVENLDTVPQCRKCFHINAHHKFRAALGSTKVVPRDANVLVIANGSGASVVLLDMIRFALRQDQFRRLRFSTKILFLDEHMLVQDATTRKNRLEAIMQFDLDTYYYALGNGEPVSLVKVDDTFELPSLPTCSAFTEIIHGFSTLTSRQDYLNQYRKAVARRCAQELSCDLIFTPEINVTVAQTLLTDIALGRGASTASNVSFLDDRGLRIIRPIRDLGEKEVIAYLKLNALKYATEPEYGQERAATESIHNLTESFVRNLQTNFPATVTTVFRTGDKLATIANEHSCRICRSPLDVDHSETIFAIEFSRLLSTTCDSEAAVRDSAMTVPHLNGNANHNGNPDLCHSCSNILIDSDNESLLTLS